MTKSSIKEHETALIRAFADVISAEKAIAREKAEMDRHKLEVNKAESSLQRAWETIAGLMKETGEVEVLLPGETTDYRIGYGTPRESVSIENPDAVPDEWCKMERAPKKKEIGEHLKALRDAGEALPNWAKLERGEAKLQWKAVKRS